MSIVKTDKSMSQKVRNLTFPQDLFLSADSLGGFFKNQHTTPCLLLTVSDYGFFIPDERMHILTLHCHFFATAIYSVSGEFTIC